MSEGESFPGRYSVYTFGAHEGYCESEKRSRKTNRNTVFAVRMDIPFCDYANVSDVTRKVGLEVA